MKLAVEVSLTPEETARAFSEFDGDGMARFFEELGRIANEWRAEGGSPSMQWLEVGDHMRKCSCSTWEGQQVLRDMAAGLEP